jgi:hypothetical protein
MQRPRISRYYRPELDLLRFFAFFMVFLSGLMDKTDPAGSSHCVQLDSGRHAQGVQRTMLSSAL